MKPDGQIAFVLKGYPRLSETFIAQEIHALIALGLGIAIYSLRHPTDKSTHPIHDEIKCKVNYLPEYLRAEPLRVFKGLLASIRRRGFGPALALWLRDLQRDRSFNRIRRFGQALVLAAELPDNTTAIHAHFLHTPASVSRYAAIIRGLPWTCSAHAKDVWTTPQWELREKIDHCRWLTTCTAANHKYLSGLCDKNNVSLNYHGLDLIRFPAFSGQPSNRDGSIKEAPVKLISVGRAVSKKGYSELLNALANLPENLYWHFIHIGGGELLGELKNQAVQLGIGTHCNWVGAQSQQTVLEQYKHADLFVLNCMIDKNGDRDGLPNVIVEAQSQSLPVLSTNISGIPELISNGENGILVEQRDTQALTEALHRLIIDPGLRQQLGRAGNKKVRGLLDKDINIQQLYQQFIE